MIPAMEKLLEHWKAAGYEFVTLNQLHASLDRSTLPEQDVEWGEIEGRSGLLAVQAS